MAKSNCHHSFTVRLQPCAYLTTADASNLLLVFPVSFAEADLHGPCLIADRRLGQAFNGDTNIFDRQTLRVLKPGRGTSSPRSSAREPNSHFAPVASSSASL